MGDRRGRLRSLLSLAFTPGPLEYPADQALRIYAARLAVLMIVAALCLALVSTLALVLHVIGGS